MTHGPQGHGAGHTGSEERRGEQREHVLAQGLQWQTTLNHI